MGQSNSVLLKEVAAFQSCPIIEVSPYHITSHPSLEDNPFARWPSLTYPHR